MSRGKYWVTEPDQVIEPKIAASGFGSIAPKTVIQVMQTTVEKHGNADAMAYKKAGEDTWTKISWTQYHKSCRSFAKTLIHLKTDQFKIVNVLGFNSPEWFISCVGSMVAGCISAGIYTSNLADACKYISEHSKAEVVVVEGNKQLKKYTKISSELPCLKALVVYGEDIDQTIVSQCAVPVYSWEDFLKLGEAVSEEAVDARTANISAGNCASLIYTSGTTGPPKAVMISHDNITWTARNMVDHYMDLNHTERLVSYLPLSHIAAQLLDIYCMITVGGCTYFAQPDALKGSLTVTLRDVEPTVFFGVPRVWEKIQEKMVQIGRETRGIAKSLGAWAKNCGAEKTRMNQYGNGGGAPFGYGCANAIVLTKIKKALGLHKVKGCFTAAAPIAPDVLYYFGSLDIPVFEVFGQSECTGPHTVSFTHCWKIGTCGRPMKGTESMLVPENGELCYRGRHIFMGYMYMPDKTAETIDEEGWLHSGDVSEFDNDNDADIPVPSGFMKITGRIKELIITAGGENIPPVLIENEMKAAMVAISNVMVIGDQRKFLSMVVSLKCELDGETGMPLDKLAADSLFVAKQIGSTATTYTEAKACPKFKEYVDQGMKTGNSKSTSNAQIIQKWIWLPEDFSEKAGDLTPTLKLKRSVVVKKYAELIDSIYA